MIFKMTWPKQVQKAKDLYGTLWFQDYTLTGVMIQKAWGAVQSIDIFQDSLLRLYDIINMFSSCLMLDYFKRESIGLVDELTENKMEVYDKLSEFNKMPMVVCFIDMQFHPSQSKDFILILEEVIK